MSRAAVATRNSSRVISSKRPSFTSVTSLMPTGMPSIDIGPVRRSSTTMGGGRFRHHRHEVVHHGSLSARAAKGSGPTSNLSPRRRHTTG